MMLRVLIIDDEPLVRSSVRRMLRSEREVEVVGEYGDGISALEAVRREAPDLIFLDIQMPSLTGMQLVQSLAADKMPITVFITAHRDFAVEAFEANAVDYILKPFGRERIERAIERGRARIAQSEPRYTDQLLQAMRLIQEQPAYQERIAVPINGRIVLLESKKIDWVEADRNFVRLHVADRTYDLRSTLAEVEGRLDPKVFARIHRSTLVNMRQVQQIQPWFNGNHLVTLKNGVELRMSRSSNRAVREMFGL